MFQGSRVNKYLPPQIEDLCIQVLELLCKADWKSIENYTYVTAISGLVVSDVGDGPIGERQVGHVA